MKDEFRAGLAGNRLDHAQGSVLALQENALLDVELKEAGHIFARSRIRCILRGSVRRTGQGPCQRNAVVILVASEVGIHSSHQRPAANEGKLKPHALFL